MVILVRQEMNRNVKTLGPDDSVKTAAEKMAKYWMGSLVIVKGEKVVGILTERDILNKVMAAGKSPLKTKIKDIMSRSIITIDGGGTLDDAIKLMKSHDIKKLPVMEKGKLAGIITTTDIITSFGKAPEKGINLDSYRDLKVLVRRHSIDLTREIEKNQILNFLISNSLYAVDSMAIIKAATKVVTKPIFVTIAKPYYSVEKGLKAKSVDTGSFYFIDASSGEEGTKGVNYDKLSGPSDLTEILLSIERCLQSGKFDGLIFDSISTLLAYQDEEMVIRFAHSLVNKLRKTGLKGIFLCTKEDIKTSLIRNLNMLADYSVDIDKRETIS